MFVYIPVAGASFRDVYRLAQVIILATAFLGIFDHRTESRAQTYSYQQYPQAVPASHNKYKRYLVPGRDGYYNRYTRPRYQPQYHPPQYYVPQRYERRLNTAPAVKKQHQHREAERAPREVGPRKKTAPEIVRRAPGPAAKRTSPKIARKVPEPSPWQTEKLSDGPVQIVISLPDQHMTVYQGGTEVVKSPVSSGKPGYSTPAGVFSILEKRRVHFSRKYDDAPMPYMQRLTWSGIALHGGRVPGYPASHGCIRLPHAFAKELYSFTQRGAQVIVANQDTVPAEISHPVLPLPTTLADILGHTPGLGVESDLAPRHESHAEGTRVAALASTAAGAVAADMAPESFGTVEARAAALRMADTEFALARLAAFKSRSDAPLRIAITQWTARERVTAIQKVLAELGFDPGQPDGQAGRRTVDAIKAYEKASGLPVTGMVTDALVTSLHFAARRPPAESGHIYVRQNGTPVFDAAVTLKDDGTRLGTHLYTALDFGAGGKDARWTAMTLNGAEPDEARGPVASATATLDRLEFPAHVRRQLADLLTPGSTMVITDAGISNETDRGTDLIVEVD